MSWSDLANIVSQYSGASASQPPPNTEQDFSRVAQSVPANQMSSGLSNAFQSDQTPSFGNMISGMFAQSNGQQKAGILNQILGAAGPSLMNSGLLGGLAGMLGGSGTQQVTPQQAEQISPEVVQQMADHAKEQNPSVVDQASDFYAKHPTLVQGLGAGALALIMSHISKNR